MGGASSNTEFVDIYVRYTAIVHFLFRNHIVIMMVLYFSDLAYVHDMQLYLTSAMDN